MKQNDQRQHRDPRLPSTSTEGFVRDGIQQSCVSSSETAQSILTNGIIGPLILEALDGFLMLLNRDGTVQFVSDNVANYLSYSPSDLLGKSIYALIHADDRSEFERCLSSPAAALQSSCDGPLSNRSSSFSCRVGINTEEGRDSDSPSAYETMQILTILQPYPCDAGGTSTSINDNRFFLACIARRTAVVSKSEVSRAVTQFDTKQDLAGKILLVSTGDKENISLQSLIGRSIEELCHASDVPQMKKHYAQVMKIGSNLSGVYRFRMPQGHYAFVQTKSRLCRADSTSWDCVISTHSVVRQCNEESELNGSASICLMKALISRSNHNGRGEETAPVGDTIGDGSKESLATASVVTGCGTESLSSASPAAGFSDPVKLAAGIPPGDAPTAASNGLDMDDIMEYLQCQDASLVVENPPDQNVAGNSPLTGDGFTSPLDGGNLGSTAESVGSSTLSLAALQQLASECSTIDLSSLGLDSSTTLANGPPAATETPQPPPADLKQIDHEMQAILAELLMPVPAQSSPDGVQSQAPVQSRPPGLQSASTVQPVTARSTMSQDALIADIQYGSQPHVDHQRRHQRLLQNPVVHSVQPLPGSVTCSSITVHPSTPVTGSQASNLPLSSSPQAVTLIEHLRRLKHGAPTSPLLGGMLSMDAPPFHSSQTVGLKDLLLGNDEELTAGSSSARPHVSSGHAGRPSSAAGVSATSPLNGLLESELACRQARPAVILKQLLEDRSEPSAIEPTMLTPISPSVATHGITFNLEIPGKSAKRSASASELPTKQSGSPPSPFVQFTSPADDALQVAQSLPHSSPIVLREPTSVSHLWSPSSFMSPTNAHLPVESPGQLSISGGGVETLISLASPGLGSLASSAGRQLKSPSPRLSPSRNVLLRELLKPSWASGCDPMPFKLLPKLVKVADPITCAVAPTSDSVCIASAPPGAASQPTTTERRDAASSSVPPKIPRFDKSSSRAISDDTLTRHLTALWERDDAETPVTSAATPISRVGSKRKAASVSSYLSIAGAASPSPDAPITSTLLSQLLASSAGTVPAPGPSMNSLAMANRDWSLQRNLALLTGSDRADTKPRVVNSSDVPPRSAPAAAANSIFRLPTYEQVIGSRIASGSSSEDVFLPTSTAAGAVSTSAGAADSVAIASHMMLDDSELLKQLEQILSEPGLTASDIDNVLGGCLSQSLPSQSLSAVDQRAISAIQSQLMSVESAPSVGTPRREGGTLCQLLGVSSAPLASDVSASAEKCETQSRGGGFPPSGSQSTVTTERFHSATSSVGLRTGLQFGASRCSGSSSQENIVAAIVQRAAAEAAAQTNRQSGGIQSPSSSLSAQASSQSFDGQCSSLGDMMNVSFAPNISLQRASSSPLSTAALRVTPAATSQVSAPRPPHVSVAVGRPSTQSLVGVPPAGNLSIGLPVSQISLVPPSSPLVRATAPSAVMTQSAVHSVGVPRLQQQAAAPAVPASAPRMWSAAGSNPVVAGNVVMQGDLMARLNSQAAAVTSLPVGLQSAVATATPTTTGQPAKNRFYLIGTSGMTWQTVPTQVPIAVIRQPVANTQSAGAADQQFLQISFTPASAGFPTGSQSAVLIAPPGGSQHLPVLAAGSPNVLSGNPGWMQVASLPPILVKPEKSSAAVCAPTPPSTVSCNRTVAPCSGNNVLPIHNSSAASVDVAETNELPLDVLESLTELAREHTLEVSLSTANSDDASVELNSLDVIHSWLQQAESQAPVVMETSQFAAAGFPAMSRGFPAGSRGFPTAAGTEDAVERIQPVQLAASTTSWQSLGAEEADVLVDGASIPLQSPVLSGQLAVASAAPVMSAAMSTMRVKEICRRQLLAKSSAANGKSTPTAQPAVPIRSPSTPLIAGLNSPLPSPASAVLASTNPPGSAAAPPVFGSSPESVIWHAPAANPLVGSVGRSASVSSDSLDPAASPQFAMSRTSILQQLLSD